MTAGRCDKCVFWLDLNDNWAGKGECRRYPPTPAIRDRNGDNGWPQTVNLQWCGEYRPADTQTPEQSV